MPEAQLETHSVLFLSVDIVGSTQYKQKNKDLWRKTFLSFYREFPQVLADITDQCTDLDVPLRLWKAVGDELIFTARVSSESEIYHAVRCWIDAMNRYEESSLFGESLATKGGAFVATFPSPDSESSIPINPSSEDSDADVLDLNEQALLERDESRYRFDYFGPSVDTGFRVFSMCNERYFTLAVEVVWALAAVSTSEGVSDTRHPLADLVFRGSHALKGVWNGREYPLFAIDRKINEGVNKALAGLENQGVEPHVALTLCRECVKSDGWPSHIYLANALHPEFKAPPSGTQVNTTEPTTAVDGYESVDESAPEGVPNSSIDELLADVRKILGMEPDPNP